MKKIERKSNYELLRIISMLFIVLYHAIHHVKILTNCTNPTVMLIFQIIQFIIIVHVNSYILITGYFQCDKTFKQSKLWSIINTTLFYLVTITLVLVSTGVISLNSVELFNAISSEYWFIEIYILLYCICPFLNKFIASLSREDYRKLLLVLFILFSVIPYVTANRLFDNSGYTLYQFIYLYLIGAYFKKYQVVEQLNQNPFKRKLQIILIFSFVLCVMTNLFMHKYAYSLMGIHPLFNEIIVFPVAMAFYYSNPFIIIQAIIFFLFFGTLDFKSKLINFVSRFTLEVYLIHDNSFVREHLYKWVGIQKENIHSYRFILYVFVVVLGIYIVCSFIGWCRQTVYRFIYHTSFSSKIRSFYYKRVEKVKALL